MRTPTKNGGYAFPSTNVQKGMTLRDWFAGQIISGLCADPTNHALFTTESEAAESAYTIADAMIAAREAKE